MKKLIYVWLFIAIIFGGVKYTQAQLIYGTTGIGGSDNIGTIFHFNASSNPGNMITDYTFTSAYYGINPMYSSLVQAPNGKMYGLTYKGGINNKGVLYEYDPSINRYFKKIEFNGTVNGAYPYGSLYYCTTDGMLYGMTRNGGNNDCGVLFKYNITTEQLTVMYHFDSQNGKGHSPYGGLIKANNGILYGMTKRGGANDKGVIFSYIIGSYDITKLVDFNNSATPYGDLMQASNGKLYGMTSAGGKGNYGTIFEYTIGTGITYTLGFNNTNGRLPYGSLIEDPITHNLYGMTPYGGSQDKGVIFECNITNPAALNPSITKKIDFIGTNGRNPYGNLLYLGLDNKFYGLTRDNEGPCPLVNGTLFKYDNITNNLTTLYIFGGNEYDGATPYGSLIQGSNTKLYGVTCSDNINGAGVLFAYDLNGSLETKIHFQHGSDGSFPNCLVQVSDEIIYGTTRFGGSNGGWGVLFQFNPNNLNYSKIYDFSETNRHPKSILYDNSSNIIYGITDDKFFEYNLNSNLYNMRWFDYTVSLPTGIIQASNNKIYLSTESCSTASSGKIIEYNTLPPYNYTTMFDFNNSTLYGSRPQGKLVQTSTNPNIFYGVTSGGGTFGSGVIFELSIDNSGIATYTKKYDFGGINGTYPSGGLIKATNGRLYGLAGSGGAYNKGVLFEYQLNGTYTKLVDFDGTLGDGPYGSLMQGSDGKLYGRTVHGGTYLYYGTIFSCDLNNNNQISIIKNFDQINYLSDHFIEVYLNKKDISKEVDVVSSINENSSLNVMVYPNPASDYVMINNAENANIEVYNMLGNKVMNLTNISNNQQIDVTSLSKGTYILKIMQNNQVITKRISLVN